MGQRVIGTPLPPGRPANSCNAVFTPKRLCLSIFLTDLGWFGLQGVRGTVQTLTIGHTSAEEVRFAIRKRGSTPLDCEESDWSSSLRRDLQAYARGTRIEFTNVEVALPDSTDFRRRAWEATRTIGYGQTLSYAELAARAGHPRAARAVGSAMAANQIPIFIPCHRVIATGGTIGGFSAPQGIGLKRRMLSLERGHGFQ